MEKDLKRLQKVFEERDELATKNKELEARLEAVLPLEPLLRAKELGEKLKELVSYHQEVETAWGVYEIELHRGTGVWAHIPSRVEASLKPKEMAETIYLLNVKDIPAETEKLSVAIRESIQKAAEIDAILAELGTFREIILELANWLRLPGEEE